MMATQGLLLRDTVIRLLLRGNMIVIVLRGTSYYTRVREGYMMGFPLRVPVGHGTW